MTPEMRADHERSLRARLHAWRKNNQAKAKLDERDKNLRKEIGTELGILGVEDSSVAGTPERPGVKAQLITSESVKTRDEKNIERCFSELKRIDFERCCPRVIAVKELEPELFAKLRKSKSTKLRLDLVQAEAAQKPA